MLVTLIIALALVFFVMRPLLKRVLSPERPQALALPVSAEVGPPGMVPAGNEHQQMLDTSGGGAEAPTGEVPAWMNNARNMGAAQAQTLKTVGSLVQDNPKQAALIVRDWLTSGA